MTRKHLLHVLAVSALAVVPLAIGCNKAPSQPADDAAAKAAAAETKIADAIAELPEDERAVALAQKFCAVEPTSRLGSMGKPYKLEIEGQAVFLCCEGCKEAAMEDPAATLAKVAALKANEAQ